MSVIDPYKLKISQLKILLAFATEDGDRGE